MLACVVLQWCVLAEAHTTVTIIQHALQLQPLQAPHLQHAQAHHAASRRPLTAQQGSNGGWHPHGPPRWG